MKKIKLYIQFYREISRVLISRVFQLPYRDRMVHLFSLDNDKIGDYISAAGFYEIGNLYAFKFFLDTKGTLPGAAVDIGANIGNHTAFFANLFDQVYAFEPHPALFKILQGNLIWNSIKNTICFNLALGREAKSSYINQKKNFNSGTFMLGSSDINSHEVEITTADEIFLNHEQVIVFVKIDVEGFEKDVLQGMKQTIKRHQPIIWFEAENRENANSTIELLRTMGYQCFRTPWPSAQKKGSIKRYLMTPYRRFELVNLDQIHDQHYSCIIATV